MRSKKAQEYLVWIPRIIMIYAVVGAFVYFSLSIRGNLTNSEDVVFYPLMERIVSSPSCFAYEDSTGGVTGIIDYDKFTQERFDNCFNDTESKIAARVKLKTEGEEKTVYNKQDMFDEYFALKTIAPEVKLGERRFPVKVVRGSRSSRGVLSVEIAWYQE